MMPLAYHEATKHHFGRFARSLGYLDWATQPAPFRRFEGAATHALPREPVAAGVPYSQLYVGGVHRRRLPGGGEPAVVPDRVALGDFLRCALGLSAWKQSGPSRWALRVNPSSGNLHPTEAYVITGEADGGRVSHYDPRDHLLETRCAFDGDAWRTWMTAGAQDAVCLVVLTSVHWREAWKYGERAFRYCQHDIGHALGALRLSAARLGWSARALPWPHEVLASLAGVDRGDDYAGAEPEEPAVALLVSSAPSMALSDEQPDASADERASETLRAAIAGGRWTGRATRLSTDVVSWPLIDAVAQATRSHTAARESEPATGASDAASAAPGTAAARAFPGDPPSARDVILHRRSALGFDPQGWVQRDTLLAMLERLNASDRPPWDLLPWEPLVHLVLFIHRVEGLPPGIYAWLRGGVQPEALRASLRSDFLWEPVADASEGDAGLFLLAPLDVRPWAQRLSCDQDIASDGFLSLAMLARTGVVAERGGWWYRRLFWECGLIGQMLYLDAEAVGARSTGIGCFYDDAVHQTLGLTGHEWQSLYHFSMGLPVDDARLTTEPGYPWDVPGPESSPRV